jgi:hypothetical protein
MYLLTWKIISCTKKFALMGNSFSLLDESELKSFPHFFISVTGLNRVSCDVREMRRFLPFL